MRRSISTLALLVAMGLSASPAGANLDANAVSAAVALPFITTAEGAKTYLALTNAGGQAITIEGRLIEGNSLGPNYVEYGQPGSGVDAPDPDANWSIQDFECPMTPKETLFFEVTWAGDAARLEAIGGFACPDLAGNPLLATSDTSGGMVFFSVKVEPGLAAENILFADWAVVDLKNGLAFGAEGIGFQAIAGRESSPGVFAFDQKDLSSFPGALTTNFLLPVSSCDLRSSGRCFALILFTLDGVVGTPPNVPISVDWYDQFERHRSSGFSFECWTFRYLRPATSSGSFVGHLELRPRSSGGRSFHGWVVQRDPQGGTTWARALAQSSTNGPDAIFTTE